MQSNQSISIKNVDKSQNISQSNKSLNKNIVRNCRKSNYLSQNSSILEKLLLRWYLYLTYIRINDLNLCGRNGSIDNEIQPCYWNHRKNIWLLRSPITSKSFLNGYGVDIITNKFFHMERILEVSMNDIKSK